MDELSDYRAKHRQAYLQRKREEEAKLPTATVTQKTQVRSPPSTASAPAPTPTPIPPHGRPQTWTSSANTAASVSPAVPPAQPQTRYTTTTSTSHHYPAGSSGPTSYASAQPYASYPSSSTTSYAPSAPSHPQGQPTVPPKAPSWFPQATRVPLNAPVVSTTTRPAPPIPQRLTGAQSVQAQIEADERLARQLLDEQSMVSESIRPPDSTFKETLIESGRGVTQIPAVRNVMPSMGPPEQVMQPRRVIGNAYGPPTNTFGTRTVSPGDAPTYRNAQYPSTGTPTLLNRSPLASGESDNLHTPSPIASDEDEQMQAAAYASLTQHPR